MEILRKTAVFRVEKQTQGMDPEAVTNISLSGVPVTAELIEKFPNLRYLTLVSMKPTLKSLAELPLHELSELRALEVSDNAISLSDAEASPLPALPNLRRLLMVNNKINSEAEIEALARAFPALEVLDLDANPIDLSEKSIFQKVFGMFPSLLVLNNMDREMKERFVEASDDDEEEEDEEDDDDEEESDEEASGSSEETAEDNSDSADEEEEEEDDESDASEDESEPAEKRARQES